MFCPETSDQTGMSVVRTAIWMALLLWAVGAEAAVRTVNRPAVFFAANCGGKPGFLFFGGEMRGCFGPGGAALESNGTEIKLRFLGVSRHARLEGLAPLHARLSVLRGSEPRNWQSTSEAYEAIRYADLYPGIDAVYHGGALKSEFYIRPGADPAMIRYRYGGGPSPRLDTQGNLIFGGPRGNVREWAPVAYQERDGARVQVAAAYRVQPDGTVGFQIGAYDSAYALVIDPVLDFSTVYGGSGIDVITSVAVDGSGNTYFAGYTDSTNLLVLNSLRAHSGGGVDAFVGKLNPAGQLVYATYLGGVGDDRAFGLAVDTTGSVVVTGWTASPDFPTANPYQRFLAGGRNAFIARLNPAGNGLIYSTFFGGSGIDAGDAIALDSAGNAYVAGGTTSPNFPLRNPAQAVSGGGQDAFLAKFTTSGSPVFSTYFGGSGDDRATGVAIDQNSEPYMAGATVSVDFPTLHAIQPANRGAQNAFIAKFNAAGSSVVYSTYLGGSGGSPAAPELATGIAVDASGAAYVAGVTSSTDFPTVAALSSSMRQGDTDAFVAKIDAAGAGLVYSTYLGGSGYDQANGIAVDASGNAYVAGYTHSDDFPLVAAVQGRAGDYDDFVAILNPAGNALVFSTYLGGNASDSANAIAIDSNGEVYIGGQSASNNFPLVAAIQNAAVTPGGTLTKIEVHPRPAPVSVTPSTGSGTTQLFSFLASDNAGATDLAETYALFVSSGSSATCYIAFIPPGSIYLMNDTVTAWSYPVEMGSAGTAENGQCRVSAAGSSVTNMGANQTLSLNLTFKPAFSGTKTIYLAAASSSGAFASLVVGSWSVPGLSVVSITPSSGSGSRQVFSFTSYDPAGASDVGESYVGFYGGSGGVCLAAVIPPGAIYLMNDANSAWLGPIAAGSAATVSNSQCLLTAADSSVTSSGNNQVLSLDFTFKPAFAGAAVLAYWAETSGGVSSSLQYATWNVPGLQSPSAVSIAPSSGSGSHQVFTLISSDSLGAANLYRTFVQVGAGSSRMCYVAFLAPSSIYLLDDSETYWLAPITIGSSASVANSQCRVDAASSSVALSGNTQALSLDLTFDPSFNGLKTVLLETQNFGLLFSNVLYSSWTP
jgi:hypothetical protein